MMIGHGAHFLIRMSSLCPPFIFTLPEQTLHCGQRMKTIISRSVRTTLSEVQGGFFLSIGVGIDLSYLIQNANAPFKISMELSDAN